MLEIIVGGKEHFDEVNQQFVNQGGMRLRLEHSLVSLSKWESIFETPFLGKKEKKQDHVLTYVECMIVEPENPPAGILQLLSDGNLEAINAHIDKKMTATWFSDGPSTRNREVITAEVIYYWMTAFNIPWEAQHWHLNKLLTLIRVCNEKQAKPKKMSRAEIAARNHELNERRKKELGTAG